MPLVTGSIGTRAVSLQLLPLVEVLKTMSLDEHFVRKRQSSHATYTRPAASISALGRGPVRRSPSTPWKRMLPTATPLVQDAPPVRDVNASIFPFRLSKGTTTAPSGCTTGCPPRPLSCPAVSMGALQVSPPSCDVAISSTSPAAELSSSV